MVADTFCVKVVKNVRTCMILQVNDISCAFILCMFSKQDIDCLNRGGREDTNTFSSSVVATSKHVCFVPINM